MYKLLNLYVPRSEVSYRQDPRFIEPDCLFKLEALSYMLTREFWDGSESATETLSKRVVNTESYSLVFGVAGKCLNIPTHIFELSCHLEDRALKQSDFTTIWPLQRRTMHEEHEKRQKYSFKYDRNKTNP